MSAQRKLGRRRRHPRREWRGPARFQGPPPLARDLSDAYAVIDAFAAATARVKAARARVPAEAPKPAFCEPEEALRRRCRDDLQDRRPDRALAEIERWERRSLLALEALTPIAYPTSEPPTQRRRDR